MKPDTVVIENYEVAARYSKVLRDYEVDYVDRMRRPLADLVSAYDARGTVPGRRIETDMPSLHGGMRVRKENWPKLASEPTTWRLEVYAFLRYA